MVVSIIMEFENFRIVGASRTARTLRCLAGELTQLFRAGRGVADQPVEAVELVLVYEEGAVKFDASALPVNLAQLPGVDLTFLPCVGSAYYLQKNIGAVRARGDILVFLDSDTPPDPGWLEALLNPLLSGDDSTDWVAGHTYMEDDTPYRRCFGMFWYFPPRAKERSVWRAQFLFANNFAVRKEAFLAYRFRDLPGVSRGACRDLADRLRHDGVFLTAVSRAATAHPPPKWPIGFARKAIAQGRDHYLERELGVVSGSRAIPVSCARAVKLWLTGVRKVVFGRGGTRLALWDMPLGILIVSGYYLFYVIGDIATRIAPATMARRIQNV
jgi:hypothetical protein